MHLSYFIHYFLGKSQNLFENLSYGADIGEFLRDSEGQGDPKCILLIYETHATALIWKQGMLSSISRSRVIDSDDNMKKPDQTCVCNL